MSSSLKQLPEFFGDYPLDKLQGWGGYSAKRDKTMLPQNFLVDPSINCLIPDGDKVLPRMGTQVVFQGSAPILNDGSLGGYSKFKNLAGVEMDVKSYRDATQGEQILVLFNNVYVPITINPNTALNGTGRIYFSTYNDVNLDISLSQKISRLCWVNGFADTSVTPNTGRVFSWTGGISAISNIAGNVISVAGALTFRQLGFTEYFLNGALTGQAEVTINGVNYFASNILTTLAYNTLVGNFSIGETVTDTTSGATATIVANTGSLLTLTNVSGIFTPGDILSGSSSGATAIAGTFTGSELDTNSLTLNTSPAAVIGDIVTSAVEVDTLVAPFQILKQNQNYMYYGNEMFRQWFMSNQYSRPSTTTITDSNAVQDDLTIDVSTDYTGSGLNTYKLVISSITPPVNTNSQTFTGTGSGTSSWNAIGYYATLAYTTLVGTFIIGETVKDTKSGAMGTIVADSGSILTLSNVSGTFTPGDPLAGASSGATAVAGAYTPSKTPGEHIYRMVIIADTVLTFAGGVTPGFTPGELIVGSTSGAILRVVDLSGSGASYYALVSGVPVNTETFTGQSSGATSPALVAILYQNEAYLYKDGVQIIGISGMLPSGGLQFAIIGNQIANPSQIDGLQFVTSQVGGDQVGDYYTLDIQQNPGGPDQFTWQKNNGLVSTPQNLSTTPIPIEDGIFVEWSAVTGHSVGDYWIITVNQAVTRAWANFYYSIDLTTKNSVRRPGEGYMYSLPSNFWAMDTLEDSIYVNGSNGEWGYSTPKLSADLLSEDISFIPLKQVGAAKVLYPYLTGHNRNDLLFIDDTFNLNSLGRLKLIEKVQSNTMSYIVFDKFKSLSFINGSIKFQDDSIWITSPEDNIMMVYNERTKYWQPPQFIPNLGHLTVIGNSLYTHSNSNTATRSLNDPAAIGDDDVEYEVIVRGPTFAIGDGVGRSVAFYHADRWNKKATNMAFWEGYVDQAPPMKMNIYLDPDGCAGIFPTDIVPIFCTNAKNDGEFGGAQDGKNPHGSAKTIATNYARYFFEDLGVHSFYFSSVEFTCRAKQHTYQILSMGINLAQAKSNNKEYKSKILLPI